MRIRQLGVQSVLHFQDFQLDFGQEAGGLHVIYGPNEAGKSTLLRLLVDLMFGGKLEDAALDLYDARHSRLYGVMEDAKSLAIWRRRKWNSLFLFDETESELSEEALLPLLGGFDRERYTLLFGFDHERLRAGGDSLLQSGGHAGISLFEAGGGIQFLQGTLQGLTTRVDGLVDAAFRRNSPKLLNAAWNQYKDFTEKSRKTALRGDEWQRDREEIVRLELEMNRLRQFRGELSGEQAKLERVKRIRQTVLELDALRSERAALLDPLLNTNLPDSTQQSLGEPDSLSTDTPSQRLPMQDVEDIVLAVRREAELVLQIEGYRKDEQNREEKLAAVQVDGAALAVQDDVAKLMEGVGQYEEYEKDLPLLGVRLESERSQTESRLQELNPLLKLDEAGGLRIPYAVELEIRGLAERTHDELRKLQEEKRRLEDLQIEKQKLAQELQEIGEIPDVSSLKALLAESENVPDLESELTKHKTEWQDRMTQAESRLRVQTLWNGRLEELRSLQLPLAETISQYTERFARIVREQDLATSDCLAAEKALATCRDDMKNLEIGGVVPIEADLERARLHRQIGWTLVKDSWLNASVDAEKVARYAGETGLAEAFETAMEEADNVSDLMRRDSAKSARRAQLLLDEERLTRSVEEANARTEALRQKQEQLQEQWVAEWASSRVQVRTPNEMREWLNETYRPLVEELQTLDTLRRTIGRLTSEMDAWTIRFRNVFRRFQGVDDLIAGFEEAGLRRIRIMANQVRGVVEQRTLLRSRTQSRAAELEAKASTCNENIALLQTEISRLADSWHHLRNNHPHLPADLKLAGAYLDKLRGLFEGMREYDRVQTEIEHKRTACSAFKESVEKLRAAMSETGAMDAAHRETANVSASGFVRALHGRIQEALQAQKSAHEKMTELERVRATIEERAKELEQVRARLGTYISRYRCRDTNALLELVETAKQLKVADDRIAGLEEQLRRSGDGFSQSELTDEVRTALSPDEIEARLQVIVEELKEQERVSERIGKELWEAKARFDALDGQNTEAAEFAQAAEMKLGEVDRLWNETLRLELARRLLQRAIEDFRRKNESAVLHRAEELFKRLTVGRYQELSVQYDGLTPYLEAKDWSGAKRRVHQMSDGTRDQLYLALRLAFVEQHASSGHTMPLIMDDILVHYDDERSQATLEILAELSRDVQVLYFTHHQSIVDAASALRSRNDTVGNHQRICVHDIDRSLQPAGLV